jgi:hypothetical protein
MLACSADVEQSGAVPAAHPGLDAQYCCSRHPKTVCASLPAAINPKLPGWLSDIRTDNGTKRVNACAELYEVLRQWEVRVSGDELRDWHVKPQWGVDVRIITYLLLQLVRQWQVGDGWAVDGKAHLFVNASNLSSGVHSCVCGVSTYLYGQ